MGIKRYVKKYDVVIIMIILLLWGALYYEIRSGEKEQDMQYTEYIFLQTLASKFASAHNYTIGQYDCKNYSRDFNFILENLGYDASVAGGFNMINGTYQGHAWNKVTISIEPISGEIKDYSKKYNFSISKSILEKISR